MLRFRSTAILTLCVLLTLLPACVRKTAAPATGVNPVDVQSEVDKPNDLLEISRVFPGPLVFGEDARGALGNCDSLREAFVAVFTEELGRGALQAAKGTCLAGVDLALHQDWLDQAAKAGADGILVGSIHQFRERDGSLAGFNTPAVLGLTLRIFSVSSGKEVWKATYHFEDRRVTNDVFQIKNEQPSLGYSSGKTAREMFRSSVTLALRDFTRRREALYGGHSLSK